jgi:hypothetical protein
MKKRGAICVLQIVCKLFKVVYWTVPWKILGAWATLSRGREGGSEKGWTER